MAGSRPRESSRRKTSTSTSAQPPLISHQSTTSSSQTPSKTPYNSQSSIYTQTLFSLHATNNFIVSNSLQNSIQLTELHLHPDPLLPPRYHTTKDLPLDLIQHLLKAFQTAKFSFSDILTNLKPNLLIYDAFQPWAPQLAQSHGIPAVHFVIIGAATRSFVHQNYICSRDDFPFPELGLSENDKRNFDDFIHFIRADIFDSDKDILTENFRLSAEVVLLKTCRALEGKYIDYLSSVSQKRIVAVGSLATNQN